MRAAELLAQRVSGGILVGKVEKTLSTTKVYLFIILWYMCYKDSLCSNTVPLKTEPSYWERVIERVVTYDEMDH